MKPKARLLDRIPDEADWAIALFPEDGVPVSFRIGIEDKDAVRLLRALASQLERGIVPDPESDTHH